jgi:hypothetical protein
MIQDLHWSPASWRSRVEANWLRKGLQGIHFPFILVLYTHHWFPGLLGPFVCMLSVRSVLVCVFVSVTPPAKGLCVCGCVQCMHACLSIAPVCRYAYVSIWISIVVCVCVAFLSICTACLHACLSYGMSLLWAYIWDMWLFRVSHAHVFGCVCGGLYSLDHRRVWFHL